MRSHVSWVSCALATALAACGALPPTRVALSIPRQPAEDRPEVAVLEVEYLQDYLFQRGARAARRPVQGDFVVFDPRSDLATLPVLSDPTNATLLVPGRMPGSLPKWPTLRRDPPPTQVLVAWPAAPTRAEEPRVRYARFAAGQPLPPDAPFEIHVPQEGAWLPRPATGWTPYAAPAKDVPTNGSPSAWRSFDVMALRPVPGATATADLATVFAVRYDVASKSGEALWIEQRVTTTRFGGPEFPYFGFPAWPGQGDGRVVDVRGVRR